MEKHTARAKWHAEQRGENLIDLSVSTSINLKRNWVVWRFLERWFLRLSIVYFSCQLDRRFLRQTRLTDTMGIECVCVCVYVCMWISVKAGLKHIDFQWNPITTIRYDAIVLKMSVKINDVHTFKNSCLLLLFYTVGRVWSNILHKWNSLLFLTSIWLFYAIFHRCILLILRDWLQLYLPALVPGVLAYVPVCVWVDVFVVHIPHWVFLAVTYCSTWMDKILYSVILKRAIMQYNGQDIISFWMHMKRHMLLVSFMQRCEAIVTVERDAGDAAVLTAASMLRSLLTAIN